MSSVESWGQNYGFPKNVEISFNKNKTIQTNKNKKSASPNEKVIIFNLNDKGSKFGKTKNSFVNAKDVVQPNELFSIRNVEVEK